MMKTAPPPNLTGIMSALRDQALEMDTLRAALDVQFKRIAAMQAELDLLPHARKRRQTLFALLAAPPSRNGDRRNRE